MTVHRMRAAISEPRFVDRFQAGRACAFEEVFDATVSAARALALRVCGNATLAEDALQDAYLEIWWRSATYDPARGSIKTWVITSCSIGAST